jgi:hypothetical protein
LERLETRAQPALLVAPVRAGLQAVAAALRVPRDPKDLLLEPPEPRVLRARADRQALAQRAQPALPDHKDRAA